MTYTSSDKISCKNLCEISQNKMHSASTLLLLPFVLAYTSSGSVFTTRTRPKRILGKNKTETLYCQRSRCKIQCTHLCRPTLPELTSPPGHGYPHTPETSLSELTIEPWTFEGQGIVRWRVSNETCVGEFEGA